MTKFEDKLKHTAYCNDRSIYQKRGWDSTQNLGWLYYDSIPIV